MFVFCRIECGFGFIESDDWVIMGYECVMFFFVCSGLDGCCGCLFFVDGCWYEVVVG